MPRGGPAICNVSVTNVCNATCDFCNFAHDKGFVTHRNWLDADRFAAALALLRERASVRFVTFMGGEPLLHPRIVEMAQDGDRHRGAADPGDQWLAAAAEAGCAGGDRHHHALHLDRRAEPRRA